MALVVAKESFSTDWNGYPTTIVAGDLRDSDDPLVKAYSQLFKEGAEVIADRAAPVEQATKAPGEKRAVKPKAKKGPV